MRVRSWVVSGVFLSVLGLLAGCQQRGGGGESRNKAEVPASGVTPGESRAESHEREADCKVLPTPEQLRQMLIEAPQTGGDAGGLFGGRKQWAALVNRDGELCAIVVSTDDPAASWPGSRNIAIAKASTANAFSTDDKPMSTARLYTLTQPGHSLFGAGAANPLNPLCSGSPRDNGKGNGKVCGGAIVFGGGLPLYKGGTRVGGLGTSGDTACADHEISKRIRAKAGLEPQGGSGADDITYSKADGPTVFTHPLCPNTWRNGQRIGDEPPASGY
jgi:uncharacterized protein GlcG (DUF336 family)